MHDFFDSCKQVFDIVDKIIPGGHNRTALTAMTSLPVFIERGDLGGVEYAIINEAGAG
ncbi:MAG TPA: hypothetical protein VFE47_16905 [Tepidisphaeraceae bacterium]|jgi:hypothetical protein|nr:hypothetical protein [Tepidisphaeraceae bacterium]